MTDNEDNHNTNNDTNKNNGVHNKKKKNGKRYNNRNFTADPEIACSNPPTRRIG